MIAYIPLDLTLLVGCIPDGIANMFPATSTVFHELWEGTFEGIAGRNLWTKMNFMPITTQNVDSLRAYVPMALCWLFVGCLTLCIFWAYDEGKESIKMCIVLFAGICARMIFSLSPTLYASSVRTFVPLYGMVLYILILNCQVKCNDSS